MTEFFKFAANTYACLCDCGTTPYCVAWLTSRFDAARILFQRGVYPADDFHMVKKYGQTVLVTQDLALENYLEKYVCGNL